MASTTILLACSNTTKPSTTTSHSQEKTSSEKTKEVSIGNYINQSKKAPQLWYEIDGEKVIKGVYAFEDNQVTYYMILLMKLLQILKQPFLLHNLKLTMLEKMFTRLVEMFKASLIALMEKIRQKKFLKKC